MSKVQRYVNWNGFKAYSDNLPEQRAGAYQITNLVNGKVYIGIGLDVSRRSKDHARTAVKRPGRPSKKLGKFANALRKYGAASFLVEPVLYSLTPLYDWDEESNWLRMAEAALIIANGSIENGYNVLANWYGGPYGEAYRSILSAALQAVFDDPIRGPALRAASSAKTKADFEDPIRRQKQSDAIRAYFESNPEEAGRYFRQWWSSMSTEDKAAFLASREPQRMQAVKESWADPIRRKAMTENTHTPEAHAKRTKSLKETWSDPVLRQNQSDALKRYLSDPEILTARRVQIRTSFAPAGCAAAKAKISGGYWANDGRQQKRFALSEQLPEGWVEGRLTGWVTNGKENRMHRSCDPLPDGFRPGRNYVGGRGHPKVASAV